MNNNDINEVLALLKDSASLMLDWSWEGTIGFEEQLEEVGRIYGFEDTLVVFSSQSAAIQIADRHIIVKCGIPDIPPLFAVPELKTIFRKICSGKLSAEEARLQIKAVRDAPSLYSKLLQLLGVVLLATGFSTDVVGTWEGMWVAAVTAIPAGLCFLAAGKIKGFNKIAGFAATALVGIIVMLAWKFGWVKAAPGLLLISATFVFIPGDSISIQALEMAVGKWGPAVDRLFYSIMVLVLQVSGAVLAAVLTNSAMAELFPAVTTSAFSWWAAYPSRIIFTLGTMLAFQMRRKDFFPALIIVWVTTATAQFGTMLYGEFFGTFLGMFVATIAATLYARPDNHSPAYVFLITPIFALSPGSHGMRAMETWLSGRQVSGVQDIATLAGTLIAIAFGMLVGAIVFNVRRSR